jgi:hypothetical protein
VTNDLFWNAWSWFVASLVVIDVTCVFLVFRMIRNNRRSVGLDTSIGHIFEAMWSERQRGGAP